MAIKRRELLAFAGLTAGGFMGAGCAERSSRGDLADLEGEGLHDSGGSAEFTLLASPSGRIGVVNRRGENLGWFGLATLLESLRQEEERPPEKEVSYFLAGMPESLLPIALHPQRNVHSLEAGYVLDLRVISRIEEGQGGPSGRVIEKAALKWDAKFKTEDYFIRISLEKHYLGGCIKRDAWHAGVLVRHMPSNTMMFDLHVASWWEQWRPCFAVYESKASFCRNSCNYPTWSAVVVAIYTLLAAGLATWLAWVIASAVGAAVVGALIVIPGVPPPP